MGREQLASASMLKTTLQTAVARLALPQARHLLLHLVSALLTTLTREQDSRVQLSNLRSSLCLVTQLNRHLQEPRSDSGAAPVGPTPILTAGGRVHGSSSTHSSRSGEPGTNAGLQQPVLAVEGCGGAGTDGGTADQGNADAELSECAPAEDGRVRCPVALETPPRPGSLMVAHSPGVASRLLAPSGRGEGRLDGARPRPGSGTGVSPFGKGQRGGGNSAAPECRPAREAGGAAGRSSSKRCTNTCRSVEGRPVLSPTRSVRAQPQRSKLAGGRSRERAPSSNARPLSSACMLIEQAAVARANYDNRRSDDAAGDADGAGDADPRMGDGEAAEWGDASSEAHEVAGPHLQASTLAEEHGAAPAPVWAHRLPSTALAQLRSPGSSCNGERQAVLCSASTGTPPRHDPSSIVSRPVDLSGGGVIASNRPGVSDRFRGEIERGSGMPVRMHGSADSCGWSDRGAQLGAAQAWGDYGHSVAAVCPGAARGRGSQSTSGRPRLDFAGLGGWSVGTGALARGWARPCACMRRRV